MWIIEYVDETGEAVTMTLETPDGVWEVLESYRAIYPALDEQIVEAIGTGYSLQTHRFGGWEPSHGFNVTVSVTDLDTHDKDGYELEIENMRTSSAGQSITYRDVHGTIRRGTVISTHRQTGEYEVQTDRGVAIISRDRVVSGSVVPETTGTVAERTEILCALVETFEHVSATVDSLTESEAVITIRRYAAWNNITDAKWSVSLKASTPNIYILDDAGSDGYATRPNGAWYAPMDALVHLYRELSA